MNGISMYPLITPTRASLPRMYVLCIDIILRTAQGVRLVHALLIGS